MEGQSATCYVNRSLGHFGSVMVQWRINSTTLNDDFIENKGILEFEEGEIEKVA